MKCDWLKKKREVKTRHEVVNLAQDTHARSGELLRGAQDAQGAQVSCSECAGYSGELTEPRVI
jgi:hypothetical protein